MFFLRILCVVLFLGETFMFFMSAIEFARYFAIRLQHKKNETSIRIIYYTKECLGNIFFIHLIKEIILCFIFHYIFYSAQSFLFTENFKKKKTKKRMSCEKLVTLQGKVLLRQRSICYGNRYRSCKIIAYI